MAKDGSGEGQRGQTPIVKVPVPTDLAKGATPIPMVPTNREGAGVTPIPIVPTPTGKKKA